MEKKGTCGTRERKERTWSSRRRRRASLGGSTLTETTQDASWCRGPHPNSHGLKPKKDVIGPKVGIQVWMDSGELAERKASSKALRQYSRHLLAWLCSQGLLLGHISLRNGQWPPAAGSHLLSVRQLCRREELPAHSSWDEGLSLGQSLLPAG